MKEVKPPPSQGKDQAGQFPLTLSCLRVCVPSAHKGHHWSEAEAHSFSAAPLLPSFDSQNNRWQCTPPEHNSFLKSETRDNTPRYRGDIKIETDTV